MNLVAFFANRVRMNGIAVGSREDFEAMCETIDKHQLRPVVDSVFPLTNEGVQGAFELMHKAGHFGNIVVETGGAAAPKARL